jgi:hypothetical protein
MAMQPIDRAVLEDQLRQAHEARKAPTTLNRHERRAVAVMERREAAKRAVEQRVAPTFHGTGVTLDIISG